MNVMPMIGAMGGRPMSVSGRSPPRSSASRGDHRSLWAGKASKVRALLSTLAARQLLWRRAQASYPDARRFAPPSTFLDSRTHLQKYCEHALDAHTIEDAIFWHSEIINELSVEIFSVDAKPWSNAMKAQSVADLSELQSRHGAILHRLTGIVARNEQFVWQPQSLCQK
jgi:hypothetical protein